MHKNYNFKRVVSNRSYSIADLCRLHSDEGLHLQTVRGWIRHHGLKAFAHKGKLYIFGAVWKEYLQERNNKKKRKLEFRQLKCRKCKAIVEPKDGAVQKLEFANSGGLQAIVICSHCGHQQSRFYKRIEHTRLYDNFLILKDVTGILCDSSNSPNKTHLILNEKERKNESSESTTSHLYNAHLMITQTNLLEIL